MVWGSFVVGLMLGIAVLAAPGYIVMRSLSASPSVALCTAPVISVALYNILAVLYSVLGVSCGFTTLFVPLVVVALALLFASRRLQRPQTVLLGVSGELGRRPLGKLPLSFAGISIAVAVLGAVFVTVVFYLSSLGDPNAFLSNYDNAFHLTHLRSFVDTGDYSSLAGGFYPSAWHCLGALIMSATGCDITVAEQAASLSFVVFAFPLGMSVFLATVFPDKPRRVVVGSLFCLCTWFFPWKILLFGPLYPNVASFTLMPASLALFIRLTGEEGTFKDRLAVLVPFVLAGIALVFAQPNTIFFSYLFVVPYLMYRVRVAVAKKLPGKKGTFASVVAEVVLLAACVAAWVALLSLPFMRSLVAYERDTPLALLPALRKLLTFQFVIWRPQYLLCAMLFVGAVRLLLENKTRWVAFSYGVLGFVYLASVSFSGLLRGYISGFCYNDYYRTAACVCIASVPLVAAGLDSALSALKALLRKSKVSDSGVAAIGSSAFALAVAWGFNYFPLFNVPRFASWGFDTIAYEVNASFNYEENRYYTEEEEAFVTKAKAICGSELVVNQPYDGSVFSYGLDDLNVLFPQYGFSQDGDKGILKERLVDVGQDEEVAASVRRLGAKYLLQLDQGSSFTGMSRKGTICDFSYEPSEWVGINQVRDDTPGFKLLLSDGDMRLYEICV